MLFYLLVMLALSIANAAVLILFTKRLRLLEQNLNAILEKYKLLKVGAEFNDYFDKEFKSLQERKKSIMERVNETNTKHNEDKKIDGAYTEQEESIFVAHWEAVSDNQGMEA